MSVGAGPPVHDRIDAHQHVWALARGDYAWITPDLDPLYRDYSLADLEPHLAAAGVTGTILVQCAPTEAETSFLLDVARQSDGRVRGVVGWVDLPDPQAPERLHRLAGDPLFAGVRPMLQDLADPAWMLQPALAPALGRLAALGCTFDALVKPVHLPFLRRFLDRYPDLALVVDHGAKPEIGGGQFDDWAGQMRAIARESRACVKLSGLVTEAGPGWTTERLRPWVDHLLECFGTQRILWGSDWPVVNLAGGYARWWAATAELLRGATDTGRAAILGGNALRFYRREHDRNDATAGRPLA